MVDIKNKSWFMSHQPKLIDELIFDNNEHEKLVKRWIHEERIDGNVLFYGPAGLGKTATAEILINNIIKAQNDLFVSEDRSIKEIREEIKPFLTKRPVKSKQKIVYIEEVDKISIDAVNVLKKGLLEKFQDNNSFICCTNYIRKIDPALLTRFTYKISFSGTNIDGIFKRLSTILNLESAEYNAEELKTYIEKNYKSGIRELINTLQSSYLSNNKKIDFQHISSYSGLEEKIINLFHGIIKIFISLNLKNKRLCMINPLNSQIAKEYQQFVTILHNNYDINFENIYDRLKDLTVFVPLQIIIVKHAENNDFKKYPHINLIGCLMECLKSLIEISSM